MCTGGPPGGTGAVLLPLLFSTMATKHIGDSALASLPAAALPAGAGALFFLGWLAPRPGYWPKPDPSAPHAFFFPEIKLAGPVLGALCPAAPASYALIGAALFLARQPRSYLPSVMVPGGAAAPPCGSERGE